MIAAIPKNETERLAALHRYDILDTAAAGEFDDITRLASHICGTPIAMISLVDERRQWFKSRVGIEERETSRDIAFCAHGILQAEVFVVPDATEDERFYDNPLVTGPTGVRFYAGAPLITSDGHALGMICVNDRVKRDITQGQKEALEALSRQTVALLEAKRISDEQSKTEKRLRSAQEALSRRQAELRVLFDLIPGMIWFKDTHNRQLLVNKRAADALGRRPEEFEGRPTDEFYPEQAGKFYRDDLEVIRSGKPKLGIVESMSQPDGSVQWVRTDKVPYCDSDGIVIGIVVMAQDITEQKEAEERLRLQARVIERMNEGVVVVDGEGGILSTNSAADRMFGYAPGEIIGRHISMLSAEEEADALRFTQEVAATVRDGGSWEGELRRRRKDGTAFPAKAQISGFVSAGKRHSFTVQEDITERKRAERELGEAHRELVEISRKAGMSEIATNVLHNVGNVLNSVNVSAGQIGDILKRTKIGGIAAAEVLLSQHAGELGPFFGPGGRGEKLRGYLKCLAQSLDDDREAASDELQLLRRNIEHVMEIVAMQQSYANVFGAKEPIDPTELVENSLQLNLTGLERGKVRVVRDYMPIGKVMLDKHKALQVLINLMRNARHACEACDREDKRLTLRLRKEAGRVRISVEDTGIGIPAENMTRIFSHGFTTKKNGHGFGLHGSALAAKEMGGSLTAFSAGPGKGAVFTLELPATAAE